MLPETVSVSSLEILIFHVIDHMPHHVLMFLFELKATSDGREIEITCHLGSKP